MTRSKNENLSRLPADDGQITSRLRKRQALQRSQCFFMLLTGSEMNRVLFAIFCRFVTRFMNIPLHLRADFLTERSFKIREL